MWRLEKPAENPETCAKLGQCVNVDTAVLVDEGINRKLVYIPGHTIISVFLWMLSPGKSVPKVLWWFHRVFWSITARSAPWDKIKFHWKFQPDFNVFSTTILNCNHYFGRKSWTATFGQCSVAWLLLKIDQKPQMLLSSQWGTIQTIPNFYEAWLDTSPL